MTKKGPCKVGCPSCKRTRFPASTSNDRFTSFRESRGEPWQPQRGQWLLLFGERGRACCPWDYK